MNQIHLLRPHELSPALRARWAEIVGADRTYESPFFRPEFTLAVSQVRKNVEIGVIESAGRVVGFFPFQRCGNVAKPVGGLASDFHAIILDPTAQVDLRQLIVACHLRAWYFDHLVERDRVGEQYAWNCQESWYIDVSEKLAQLAEPAAGGSSTWLGKMQRKARRLADEVGPLRFVADADDPRVFERLIEWKSRQFAENRLYNLFACGWTTELFKGLITNKDENLRGRLCALYAGDCLVATYFAMQSHHVLHSWVQAYNHQFPRYSPGLQLWLALLQAAPSLGIKRIDLGKGDEEFKRRLGTGYTLVAEGSFDLRYTVRTARLAWHQLHRRLRASRLRGPLTTPWRIVKHMIHQYNFR